MKLLTTALILTLALFLGACGLTAPRSDDGYADLDSLGVFDTDRTLALSLGPTILGFAARHVDDDPEAKALLSGLDGVRVRIYEIDGDPVRVAERLDAMSKKLQHKGWEPVMLVREEDEQAHMLIKTRGEHIRGMVVMVSDQAEEVVLVNLMGDLKPEMFGDAMVALDVDTPEVRVASVH
jgi:hypothetical protein